MASTGGLDFTNYNPGVNPDALSIGGPIMSGNAPDTILSGPGTMSGVNPQSWVPANQIAPNPSPPNYAQTGTPYTGGSTAPSPYNGAAYGPGSAEQQRIDSLTGGLNSAAQKALDAQLASTNTAFDYQAAQLNGQLPTLQNQYNQGLSQIDLNNQQAQDQGNTSKTNAQNQYDQAVQQAGGQAKNTQFQNRNVLRALGLANSSIGADLLTRPITEFDKAKAQLTQGLTQHLGQVDDWLNGIVQQGALQKNNLVQNYQDLVGKIQTDLRFNERQRLDAVQSANAALTQRLSDIQNAMLNYQQQADQYKAYVGAQVQGLGSQNTDFTTQLNSALNAGLGSMANDFANVQVPTGQTTGGLFGWGAQPTYTTLGALPATQDILKKYNLSTSTSGQ